MNRGTSVFHMSLNRPRLVAGVGSEAFGLIVVMGVMAMNLRSVPIALCIPPLYLFLRWVYRKDAVLLKAFLQIVDYGIAAIRIIPAALAAGARNSQLSSYQPFGRANG